MYSLRVSFLSPEGRRISQDELRRSVGHLTYSLSWHERFHVLRIDGFASEEAANACLRQLRVSFAWLLLDRGVPVEADLAPQRIKYCADPALAAQNLSKSFGSSIDEPIDGLLDGARAAVFETTKRLSVLTFTAGGGYVTIPAEQALDAILQGIRFGGESKLCAEPKLLVALKLYSAFFTEASATARFLTLIMSLEALATPVQRPTAALTLLNRWAAEVESVLTLLKSDSEDAAALEALRREVLFRRDSSIRSQIRRLVASVLQNDTDVVTQTKLALRLYDLRSSLVHEGTVDPDVLDTSTSQAKELVLRVLRTRFQAVFQAVR